MRRLVFYLFVVFSFSLLQGCAPPARPWSFPTPVRPATAGPVFLPPASVARSAPVPSLHDTETPSPVLTESEITEQELAVGRLSRSAPPHPSVPPAAPSELPAVKQPPAPAKALLTKTAIKKKEEASLIARITSETPPERAASLRLTEEGEKFLQTQEFEKGLSRLEKAITLDSQNRYAYFYLAQAHYHLAHHQQSLNFLEIIEGSLAEEPDWLARVYALEGENYRVMGFFDRADAKYVKALNLDPFNRIALEGLTYLPSELLLPSR